MKAKFSYIVQVWKKTGLWWQRDKNVVFSSICTMQTPITLVVARQQGKKNRNRRFYLKSFAFFLFQFQIRLILSLASVMYLLTKCCHILAHIYAFCYINFMPVFQPCVSKAKNTKSLQNVKSTCRRSTRNEARIRRELLPLITNANAFMITFLAFFFLFKWVLNNNVN